MDLSNRRVVVVGLGKSGVAAAKLCARKGASVVAADARSELPDAASLRAAGIELALGGHGDEQLASADLVVISPGVPEFPALRAAEERGVEVISEVELSVRLMKHTPRELFAIGGTNGKSTVTALVHALAEAGGYRAFIGGNFGEPLADHVDEAFDVVVLEVSSFQMERVASFRPTVCVLLNITPDHLDRYPSFEAYAAAKGNAFQAQRAEDYAVVPLDDALCERQARRGKGTLLTFGGEGATVAVTLDRVRDTRNGASYAIAEFGLRGGHNAKNVAAALAATFASGRLSMPVEVVRTALAAFRGLGHRMAHVRTLDGVAYYDDSKGTNVGASVTAILGLAEPKVVLIAGGKDKGGGYRELREALEARGRAAVLIGEAAPLLAAELEGSGVPFAHAPDLADAVAKARAFAHAGDAVLLSPACASFDMFKDYKDRGDRFVAAVQALTTKEQR
jgi:UDP-N-acetylmuramoylalanine--D-glutamate ligase